MRTQLSVKAASRLKIPLLPRRENRRSSLFVERFHAVPEHRLLCLACQRRLCRLVGTRRRRAVRPPRRTGHCLARRVGQVRGRHAARRCSTEEVKLRFQLVKENRKYYKKSAIFHWLCMFLKPGNSFLLHMPSIILYEACPLLVRSQPQDTIQNSTSICYA